MFELLCPVHGIPAFLVWVLLGGDPRILFLTFKMYGIKFKSVFGG